jgi:predicted porin
MFKLKSMLSYAAPEGWVVSGFYDYTDKQNGNNSFTDDVGGLTYNQEIDSTLQSAGLSLNVSPHENVNTYANLYWMQDDFSSYLIRSSVARWIPGVVFTPVDAPNYKIDSYVFNLGADWQYSDKLKLDGSYTFSKSTGDVASGAIQASLVAATGTIDSIIDNTLHSFALGADYLLNDRATLRVNYFYDRYEDDAYDLLSGGVHMMAVGVSYAM